MVAHSGAPVRADRLRPLSVPRPLRVEANAEGWPVVVYLRRRGSPEGVGPLLAGGMGGVPPATISPPLPSKGRGQGGGVPVLEVLDRWRIDDEWWRKEISRMYFHVMLAPQEAPLLLTIFHDLIGGRWFAQTAATPLEKAEPVHVLAPTVAEAAAVAAEQKIHASRLTPIRRVG